MGKSVDMASLHQRNEKVRAVGNVKNLNARGDTIDAFGRVIKPVNEKVNSAYTKTVGNRSANPTKPQVKIQPDVVKTEIAELLPEELELEESLEDDLEIEKIKEEELAKTSKKK
jgi:lipoate-protein ligase A